jgi:5-methylcytosine-specific restriction protein A
MPTDKSDGTNPDWSDDEHILALDLYMTAKPKQVQKASREVRELSALLLRLHTKLGTKGAVSLRNEDGVYMKLGNFKRHDPEFTGAGKRGLSRGSKGEVSVWKEFSPDVSRLRETAAAIRAAILSEVCLSDVAEDPTLADEGRVLTRVHRVYERSLENRRKKLAAFKRKHGRVFCECCGFDFEKTYGERGLDYIECHHQVAVSKLRPGQKLTLDDFCLLCSNCHRMVHVRTPWLGIEELRNLLPAR